MRAIYVVEERSFLTWHYRASYPERGHARSHARSIREQPTMPGFPKFKARVVKYVPAPAKKPAKKRRK